MMQRANSNRRGGGKKSPDYSTSGVMEFNVRGYVQEIKEGDNVDYVKFLIDNPFVKGNYNSISVEVPWDGCPQLELGDHVIVCGNIRSWWNGDIGKVTYSFVATRAELFKDDVIEKPKGRRGVNKSEGGE